MVMVVGVMVMMIVCDGDDGWCDGDGGVYDSK